MYCGNIFLNFSKFEINIISSKAGHRFFNSYYSRYGGARCGWTGVIKSGWDEVARFKAVDAELDNNNMSTRFETHVFVLSSLFCVFVRNKNKSRTKESCGRRARDTRIQFYKFIGGGARWWPRG